jgi:hypothetical protein
MVQLACTAFRTTRTCDAAITGHPDHPGQVVGLIVYPPLEVYHRGFDALGMGQQFLAEFRQAIA